jgi:hypothetical protein
MTACCPTCRRPWPLNGEEFPHVEALRESCAARGIIVAGDNTVSEPDAAKLLNRSAFTLRNWRLYHEGEEAPLAFTLDGVRARYSLSALADHLEKKWEE